MAPTIIEGEVKNGKIVLKKALPKAAADMRVQIILTPKGGVKNFREKFFGAFPKGWGDPLKYQKRIRKEWER